MLRRICLVLLYLGILLLGGCASTASRGGSPPPQPIAQPPLGQGVRDVRLLVYPDDAKRLLTTPMRAAQHSLDLTMYLLTDHTMIHELEYVHAKGVQVRVLLERQPFGNDVSGASANQSAFDQLYAADVPVRWTTGRYRLTHEKTMVIDNRTAYILTLNLSRSAFPSVTLTSLHGAGERGVARA